MKEFDKLTEVYMNVVRPESDDIVAFADDIREKLKDKWSSGKLKKETIDQVVRDMLIHKLRKEGWKKA